MKIGYEVLEILNSENLKDVTESYKKIENLGFCRKTSTATCSLTYNKNKDMLEIHDKNGQTLISGKTMEQIESGMAFLLGDNQRGAIGCRL